MNTSLQGQKILVTRERHQMNEMSKLIRERDGVPLEVPLLKITCHQQVQVDPLASYSWLIFTSANGVRCFFQHVKDPIPSNIHIAAVGKKTENVIRSYGNDVHFVPTTYNAETMMDELFRLYPEDRKSTRLNSSHVAISY